MLEIHKIKDIDVIKQLAKASQIEYTEDSVFLASYENDEIVDFLCYKQIDNQYICLYISDISSDFQIILGLVKTLIFLADIARIDSVSLPLYYERAAKAIGFTLKDGVYEMKLSDYQNKCGGCCS